MREIGRKEGKRFQNHRKRRVVKRKERVIEIKRKKGVIEILDLRN